MSTANNKISMVVKKFASGQTEQFSTVQHVNGYPWRLRVSKENSPYKTLSIICDKSDEAELWKCTTKIRIGPPLNDKINHTFESWDKHSHILSTYSDGIRMGSALEVTIATKEDGERWTRRPYLNPAEPLNGTLVVGDEKKKIPVNKEYLSSQSPFFDRLFNGDFKEKDMEEIPIGDVEYEELSNIIMLVCGEQGATLTDENVLRSFEIADRFSFKIVEDSVVSYLLSPSCSVPFGHKLLLSDQFNITFLKDILLVEGTMQEQMELCRSGDWERLSEQTRKDLFEITCNSEPSWYDLGKKIHKRKISPPPAKNKGSNTISMVVEKWTDYKYSQFSPVHRINGYPWRLRLKKSSNFLTPSLFLICDKSKEAILWQCNATVTLEAANFSKKIKFTKWGKIEEIITEVEEQDLIEVQIETEEDGGKWARRLPVLGPLDPREGVLIVGDEKKRIGVDKKSLAKASPFFDRLFYEDFIEKNLKEIPIRDVTYEEFSNFIMIAYEFEGASLTDENFHDVLQLAYKFDLKIVEDHVVAFLMEKSRLSLPEKLAICKVYNLCFFKDVLLNKYPGRKQLKKLFISPEWNDLPKETIQFFFEKMCTNTE